MIYKGINFNGSSYTSGDCKLWCNFDNANGANLFLAERHVVCLEYAGGDDPYIGPDSDTRIATYARDENDRVIIDLTDWLRTHYKNGTMSEQEISVFCPLNDDMFDLFYGVGGIFLRNPQTFPIPPTDLSDMGALIVPPSKMLAMPYGQNNFLWWDDGQSAWQWRRRGSDSDTEWARLTNGEDIGMQGGYIEIFDGNVSHGIRMRVEETPMVCGKRYACLQWRSLIGPYKINNFEIKSQKTETQGDYSLLMVDNSYNEIKGSEESLIFSIDELTMYDLWYYSDILTSSDVRLMSADGIYYAREAGGGIRLEVTTKSVTMPSGERADGKIEFEAKIKRYDAVTL